MNHGEISIFLKYDPRIIEKETRCITISGDLHVSDMIKDLCKEIKIEPHLIELQNNSLAMDVDSVIMDNDICFNSEIYMTFTEKANIVINLRNKYPKLFGRNVLLMSQEEIDDIILRDILSKMLIDIKNESDAHRRSIISEEFKYAYFGCNNPLKEFHNRI